MSRAVSRGRPSTVSLGERVLDDRVGVGAVDLLDVHAALDGADHEVALVDPVVHHRQVVLLGDVGGRLDVDHVNDVALDVELEDRVGDDPGLLVVLGELHTAGLAASADLDLGLDDHRAAEVTGGLLDLQHGAAHAAGRGYGDPVAVEQLLALVLDEVHASLRGSCGRSGERRGAPQGRAGTSRVRRARGRGSSPSP
jgi:hypothetical protein